MMKLSKIIKKSGSKRIIKLAAAAGIGALVLNIAGTFAVFAGVEKNSEPAVSEQTVPATTAAEKLPEESKVTESQPAESQPAESQPAEKTYVEKIPAGTALPQKYVDSVGLEKFFYVEEIPDDVFAHMQGKSFKENCTVPREDLRYIRCLHKNTDGMIKVGELVMHKAVADTVCDIFRQLYDADYPIESMLLVDNFDASDEDSIMADNTSAFNFRTVDGTDQISFHAYGLAIDINPYYNVYYIPSQNYVFPPEGYKYLDREADFPYKLAEGDLCFELFTQAGFEWGGWWTYNTDYQHFQFPLDIRY